MKNKVETLYTIRKGRTHTRVKINGVEVEVFSMLTQKPVGGLTTCTIEFPVDKHTAFIGRSWPTAKRVK